ncbi:HAD-IIIC family phosphatase [Eubacteriales bacterium OttesenSCG-928-G02]|nr:HAD-IIIC family phosphatase [Eubacteriales bacterium OttesenSCG-928-G02]
MTQFDKLSYPFDSGEILQAKKSIKRELLASGNKFIKKNIAVLGGSTTNLIVDIMELFLLNNGIEPVFYQSEYAQFYIDAVFGSPELDEFNPDIIYICTTNKNITVPFPTIKDGEETINSLLDNQFNYYKNAWQSLASKYNCPVIQNNFEKPQYRLLGNRDSYDIHGKTNFLNRLNAMFAEYAYQNDYFHICDIDYISSDLGLSNWYDPEGWFMYKYAMNILAIPNLSHNVANIIKSIFGKNKKVLALDMDNTLWGGVIGDDGVENIELGEETSNAQSFSEFQGYIKSHKDLGILLTVCSKNEHENAISGLNHPDSKLSEEDFILIKANWDRKDKNITDMAEQLSLGADSFVFVDDNPAERSIVKSNIDGISVPEITNPAEYISIIDKNGYFETTSLSDDDLKRNDMYKANIKRSEMQANLSDYGDYLKSLDMKAEIDSFCPVYFARITQLTNKSNQFNLTTKRYTQSEIEAISCDKNYITLYGRLEDTFGDNGVVSVVIGNIKDASLYIDLWLMSCRVLKRDMELAMLDTLVSECKSKNINKIIGYYYPTPKNKMVENLYGVFGFNKISQTESETVWELDIDNYENKNKYIKTEKRN